MDNNSDPKMIYAQSQLEDANARVRYQHEFALAGMRTLILINGGAIVALLTYAGNVLDTEGAENLSAAFDWYTWGLVSTVVGYLLAYLSQGIGLWHSHTLAMQSLGLDDPVRSSRFLRRSGRLVSALIAGAFIATVASLVSFVCGSRMAMEALT